MRLFIAFFGFGLLLGTLSGSDARAYDLYTHCATDADCERILGKYYKCLPLRYACGENQSCTTNVCRSIRCWHDAECVSLLGQGYTCNWFVCEQ